MSSDLTASVDPDGLQERLTSCQEQLAAAEGRNKRLEADRRHLAAIVEGSRNSIWSWTPDGTIVRWNAAAQRLLGYTADEMIGRSLLDLVPEERKGLVRDVMGTLSANGGGYGHYETVRVAKGGRSIDVELTVSPILDEEGVVVGASTVCRDITERKQFEASLAKRLQELTTLYELTERLQRAESIARDNTRQPSTPLWAHSVVTARQSCSSIPTPLCALSGGADFPKRIGPLSMGIHHGRLMQSIPRRSS